jgi:hypothetical protein
LQLRRLLHHAEEIGHRHILQNSGTTFLAIVIALDVFIWA